MSRTVLLWLICCPLWLSAQIRVQVTLTDQEGEALAFAHIHDLSRQQVTVTDAYGRANLSMTPGKQQLRCSYTGLKDSLWQGLILRDTLLVIRLEPLVLAEVVVKAPPVTSNGPISSQSLPISVIQKLPAVGGEADPLKALTFLPGVAQGIEGSGNIYVRGGSPDQNLILLDEAPVYNVNHLFGFLSLFNTDALRDVEVIKGNFPARYGGRLSSVVNILMKEGSNQRFKGSAGISLLSSRFLLEGPLQKDKGSFMVSARGSYLTVLAKLANQLLDPTTRINYGFWDTNAKLNYNFGHRHQLFLSYYAGKDGLDVQDSGEEILKTRFGLDWGNRTVSLRHNYYPGNRWVVKNRLIFSSYKSLLDQRFAVEDETGIQEVKLRSGSSIQSTAFKTMAEYNISSNHQLVFGLDLSRDPFQPLFASAAAIGAVNTDTSTAPVITGYNAAVYVEDRLALGEKAILHLGLRGSWYQADSLRAYSWIEPRAGVLYHLSEKTRLKAGFTQMRQPIHLAVNDGVGLPNDVWLPATGNIPPQLAHQLAAGFEQTFSEAGIKVEGEIYYKWMNRQVDFLRARNLLFETNTDWQTLVTTGGTGKVYGLELLLQKQTGRTTGLLAYTWSHNTRQFNDINQGKPFPFKYDRRHDLSFLADHKLSPKWNVSLVWVFQTGHAVTLPSSRWPRQEGNIVNTFNIYNYEFRNASRVPAYHRADLGFSKRTPNRWDGINELNFGIYNLYNRKNIFFYETKLKPGTATGYELKARYLFPIMPYIGYAVRF